MQQETILYLVRHGETDYNRKRIIQGRCINSNLNGTGQAQAKALAARFADVTLDAIYSSSLSRAQETAQFIARQHPGVVTYTLSDLEEMSWGIFEGEAFTPQVQEAFEQIRARWDQGEYELCVEGGESIIDVQQRGLRALDHILQRHAGQSVLVVTHGRFLRVLLATLLDDYGLARMHEIAHTNTGVNKVRWRNDRFSIELLNCTAHLDAPDTLLIE